MVGTTPRKSYHTVYPITPSQDEIGLPPEMRKTIDSICDYGFLAKELDQENPDEGDEDPDEEYQELKFEHGGR